MKFSGLARTAICVLVLLISGAAFAAKKEKEVNAYPDATRTEPKSDLTEREQKDLNKASELVEADKAAEARPLLEKVLANPKASKAGQSYAHQSLGTIAWDEDKEDESIAELKKAIEVGGLPNAAHFQILMRIAQVQAQSEKYADAGATLEQWQKLTGKPTAESLALQANIYYRLEKFQEAIDTMKKALALSETPNESWNQIMMASYFELNQYDEAAKVVNAQLAKSPNDIKLIKQLATIYINGDKYPQAIEVLSKAKAQGLITGADDYLQLAKLYANAEKPKEGADTLSEGLAKGVLKPSLEVYKLQGDLCAQFDDDACSIDAYGKASPLATDGNIDYQLGYILYYADRGAEAKQALARAISKGKLRQEGEAYVLKGDIESEAGDATTAMADWKKAATFPSAKVMAEQRMKAAQTGAKLKRPTKQ